MSARFEKISTAWQVIKCYFLGKSGLEWDDYDDALPFNIDQDMTFKT